MGEKGPLYPSAFVRCGVSHDQVYGYEEEYGRQNASLADSRFDLEGLGSGVVIQYDAAFKLFIELANKCNNLIWQSI